MDGALCGYPPAAREHLPARPRQCGRAAIRPDHRGRRSSPAGSAGLQTPAQARNFLDAMRGLFRWAAKARHVKIRPDRRRGEPAAKKGDGFIPWTEEHVAAYERAMADRHAAAGMARRPALHRPAPRRCRALRPPARQGRRGDDQDGEEPVHRHGDAADPAGAGRDARRRTMRGPDLHRRRARSAAHKGIIRQPVPARRAGPPACPARRTASARSRRPGRRTRRDGRAARGDLRMDRRRPWLRSTRARPIGSGLAIEAMHKLANDERTSIPAPYYKVRAGRRKPK